MAFTDGATQFMNIERMLGEDMTNLPAILTGLKPAGIGGIRNFICYSPDQGAAFGYWLDTTKPPSDARINKTLDAWSYIMGQGFKVIGGATDMNNPVSVTGASQPMMAQHIGNFARLVAARNFDPNMFAPEPVNEWAGWGDNSKTNPIRQAYYQVFRAAMPLHTIVMASDYWDYFNNASGMWTPGSSDTNWLWMFHSYESHSLGDWKTIMQKVHDVAAAAGVKALYGEFGNASTAANLSVAANVTDWQNDYYNASQAAGALGIIFAPWAITNGGAERLNVVGGYALRPEAISSIKFACSAWPAAATVVPVAAAPAPAPATPAAPVPASPPTPTTAPVAAAPVASAPAAPTPSMSFTATQTATGVHLQIIKATGLSDTLRISYTAAGSTGSTYIGAFEHIADATAAAPRGLTLSTPTHAGAITYHLALDSSTLAAAALMVPYTAPAASPAPAPVTAPVAAIPVAAAPVAAAPVATAPVVQPATPVETAAQEAAVANVMAMLTAMTPAELKAMRLAMGLTA